MFRAGETYDFGVEGACLSVSYHVHVDVLEDRLRMTLTKVPEDSELLSRDNELVVEVDATGAVGLVQGGLYLRSLNIGLGGYIVREVALRAAVCVLAGELPVFDEVEEVREL